MLAILVILAFLAMFRFYDARICDSRIYGARFLKFSRFSNFSKFSKFSKIYRYLDIIMFDSALARVRFWRNWRKLRFYHTGALVISENLMRLGRP